MNDIEILRAVERALKTEPLSVGSANSIQAISSALIALNSVTKGFLLPRMTSTQRDAIVNPTGGLLIYNTTTNKINVYTTAWEAVTSA